MRITTIFRILGLLLMVFSVSMLPPVAVAHWYQDGAQDAFIQAFFYTISTGFLLWIPFRHSKQELKTRDGFLIVVLFWSVLCLFGALPLLISTQPDISFTDAVFESVSGLTTTGTTILSGLSSLPHAILYYRQQMQFLGGMGIIVLAIAILPILGVGGMQLYRAEIPGPIKDAKLTPRITETAKALWFIYLGLTICCILAYWSAGMPLFDAIGESFSTIATGGFSMHDASFAYYHSNIINCICVFFMLLSSMNYSLHFFAIQRKTLRHYWKDIELRTYLYLLLFSVILCTIVLLLNETYSSTQNTIMNSLFNVVSLATTTGLTSSSFSAWPTFLPVFVMILAIIGGCAASTSGGIKVIRMLLLSKQGGREIKQLVHPKAIFTIKFGNITLSERVSQAIWGFIAVFIALFVVLTLLLLATGLDLTTSFGAVASCLSNAGASIGAVAYNFELISPLAKWTLVFAMIAGRLEIFTLLVLFSPTFWKH